MEAADWRGIRIYGGLGIEINSRADFLSARMIVNSCKRIPDRSLTRVVLPQESPGARALGLRTRAARQVNSQIHVRRRLSTLMRLADLFTRLVSSWLMAQFRVGAELSTKCFCVGILTKCET
jgi:hypothetical protein